MLYCCDSPPPLPDVQCRMVTETVWTEHKVTIPQSCFGGSCDEERTEVVKVPVQREVRVCEKGPIDQ